MGYAWISRIMSYALSVVSVFALVFDAPLTTVGFGLAVSAIFALHSIAIAIEETNAKA